MALRVIEVQAICDLCGFVETARAELRNHWVDADDALYDRLSGLCEWEINPHDGLVCPVCIDKADVTDSATASNADTGRPALEEGKR